MTAGTVVIIGGVLAGFILLTIVSVLCYCRLQYYCCKEEGSLEEEENDNSSSEDEGVQEDEEPEEEETSLSISIDHPSPPDFFGRSFTPPPSGPPSPPFGNKPLLALGGFEPNGPSCLPGADPFRGVRRPPGYALCPSCSGLLPSFMHRHEGLRNGGGRVNHQPSQHDFETQSEREGFRKINLSRWGMGGGRMNCQQPQSDLETQSVQDGFRKINLSRWGNGGGRVSYQHPQSDLDTPTERDGLRKMNLIRWVTLHDVMPPRSFSTDV